MENEIKVTEMPAWCETSKTEFKHAPRYVREFAKSHHISPAFYAMQAQPRSYLVYVWNSKRAVVGDL